MFSRNISDDVMARVSGLSVLTLSLVCARADYVGHSVTGEVEEGNYTYYTLRQPGHLQLTLASQLGDADLYVSGAETERPTFYFDEHELSSTTCGQDSVHITPALTRNLSGHSSPLYHLLFFNITRKAQNNTLDLFISEFTAIRTIESVNLSWTS